MGTALLNTPLHRLQQVAAGAGGNETVKAHAGDLVDVCSDHGRDCPAAALEAAFSGDLVEVTVSDLAAIIEPKSAPVEEPKSLKDEVQPSRRAAKQKSLDVIE